MGVTLSASWDTRKDSSWLVKKQARTKKVSDKLMRRKNDSRKMDLGSGNKIEHPSFGFKNWYGELIVVRKTLTTKKKLKQLTLKTGCGSF